ncbi:hypothetical protein HMPREF9062_1186, partial [Actinomyces sp. oral taxon 448 str. F0400]
TASTPSSSCGRRGRPPAAPEGGGTPPWAPRPGGGGRARPRSWPKPPSTTWTSSPPCSNALRCGPSGTPARTPHPSSPSCSMRLCPPTPSPRRECAPPGSRC